MYRGMGWLKDHPDFRDFHPRHEAVAATLRTGGIVARGDAPLPTAVDLREWCPPIDDQGQIGSCTAHAGVALLEYCESKAFGQFQKASRLFLYKATRNLMQLRGDTGAELRNTMGALALFGVPPEKYWPYSDGPDFDREPTPFCYSFAGRYSALTYFRHDPAGVAPDALLADIKHHLASQLPAMFGFTVYDSIAEADNDGRVPFPDRRESVKGGHAILAVGYDDALVIHNRTRNTMTGAFLFRNSWSTGWGDAGYGFLPYEYVLQGLATDWWSLMTTAWMETGQFGL